MNPNAATTDLSTKQQTERQVYNNLVHRTWDGKSLKIEAARPPFGVYSGDLWEAARRYFDPIAGKKVLELGCGNGELSVWMALNGADATGVDISDESIAVCQRRAAENGVSATAHFWSGPSERVPFPDQSFDLVFIAVALHHFVVEDALEEIRRVLKPGGSFVAIEPLVFSRTIQSIRSSKLVQGLYPERRETPTERILYSSDLEAVKRVFGQIEYEPFRIFSPFIFKLKPLFHLQARLFFKTEPDPERRRQLCNRANQQFDEHLLRWFPWLRGFSRYVVLRARSGD